MNTDCMNHCLQICPHNCWKNVCCWVKRKILDFNVHLKFDRGLSFSFESGLVSSLMSCLVYCVHLHYMLKYYEMLEIVDKFRSNKIIWPEYLNISYSAICRIWCIFLKDKLCTDVSKTQLSHVRGLVSCAVFATYKYLNYMLYCRFRMYRLRIVK